MYKKFVFVALFIGSVLFVSFFPAVSADDKEQELLQRLKYLLEEFHYHPKDLDDSFSEDLFNLYLERLDGGKRWFTQEDMALLEPYKLRLDDDLQALNFEFFDLSVELVKKRWEETQLYYQEALESCDRYQTNISK